MMRITDTVKHLIIINVIVFVGMLTIGRNGMFDSLFAMHFPNNKAFEPWQVVTHMFMHANFMHIGFNMLALWMFGSPVEQVLGSKRFLFIYFSAGLGAVALQTGYYYWQYLPDYNALLNSGLTAESIKSMLTSGQTSGALSQLQVDQLRHIFPFYNAVMVGASGCIMGILAAFGMMNPEARLMMIFLPIPIKAKYFIPGIIILDLISGLTGKSFFSPSNTAFFAHVGGALIGFIIMWYWKKNQFNNKRWY
ncbi:rhomboid family intramembrane serine protease [Gaetbulibacter aestuarii]|uniref:Rhomboid family intramembrane serine protease n=1 Tax=Gaetbulibacter aestuarii TaxID=1502358 RepID=A0ABW7MZV8_9FLAO